MHQEDLGFSHLRAATGGLQEGDHVGAITGAVEVGATTMGAIVGLSAIAGIIIGASWIRRRTVNTYVGASRSFAEDDDRERALRRRVQVQIAGMPRESARAVYDPSGRPEPGADRPMRRGVVEMEPRSTERLERSRPPVDPAVIEERAAAIAEGKGLIAPWVERHGNELLVIGVDPLPRFEREERRGLGSEPYEAAVGVAGAYKIRTFKIPLAGDRLGAPTPVSDASAAVRSAYRQNVPPEAFSGPWKGRKTGYPWDDPSFAPKDFSQVRAEFRAFQRRLREAKKAKGT